MARRIGERERRRDIETAIAKVAAERGREQVTHDLVAQACAYQTSTATVRRYYSTLEKLLQVLD